MIHIQSRNHLISWLEDNCPRKAIVRAIQEGQVEHLGGFHSIPPTTWPGWIVQVTSIHGRTWNVAIIMNMLNRRYEIRILKEIPWVNWMGKLLVNPLYSGDNWVKYLELYDDSNRCVEK